MSAKRVDKWLNTIRLKNAPQAAGTYTGTYDPAQATITIRGHKLPLVTSGGTPCPRCKASGQELVFMHYQTCEVCHGTKIVSATEAREETLDRQFERNKYK